MLFKLRFFWAFFIPLLLVAMWFVDGLKGSGGKKSFVYGGIHKFPSSNIILFTPLWKNITDLRSIWMPLLWFVNSPLRII